MKSVLIRKEDRESHYLSETESIILLLLYGHDGIRARELKKDILTLNGKDYDEAEEGLEALRAEGYISYATKVWKLTKDGKELMEKLAIWS